MNPVMYIFINKSLNMSTGKIAAQASHAAIITAVGSTEKTKYAWLKATHKTIIILEARDEQHLRNISKYLYQRSLNCYPIIDEGANEVDAQSWTALATPILPKDHPKTIQTFSTFKLFRDIMIFNVEVDR